ncbi:MAG: glycosyltransferase [Candidatus Heimdallarchaeota archaeon]|nr:glycosyltransferase [Candidatus Heimdallarchaeota archaeon]
MNTTLLPLLISLTITTLTSIYFLRYCKELTKHMTTDLNLNTDTSYQPTVSIIIPTYNESLVIENKIKNTLSLNYPLEKTEIIVIDSASTDDTANIAQQYDQIKTIRQNERRGKSAALAEVFEVATGEIVVITDADAILDKDVLNSAMPYLADRKVGAVTGKQVLINPNKTVSQKSEQTYRELFDLIRTAESKLGYTMIFNGPFMAFKQEVLEAPSENSVADDTEMAIKVIEKGYHTLYIPEALFYENIPLSNRSRIKQKERRAQGLVQSFWRHRGMLFNKRYGKFGTTIFPAEFAVHLVLPFALFASVIVTAVSLFIDPASTLIITLAYFTVTAAYAVVVYSDIGKFLSDPTSAKESSRIKNIAITFRSFLQLQFALLTGALKLMIFGSKHKWEQISDVRTKI